MDSTDPGGPAFNWIDISSTGTSLGLSDDDSTNIDLPFTFNYFGMNYNQVFVNSNGNLTFGGSFTDYSNRCLPISETSDIIAGFWDDLNPSAGGNVYYEVRGTAPNRMFLVEWFNVPHYRNIGNATFEIILYEGNNDIFFQYLDVDFGNPNFNDGNSATLGIQNNPDACNLSQYSCNEAVLSDLFAVLFSSNTGTFCSPDTYEPDDSAGQATTISSDATQAHSICPVGDEDWMKFTTTSDSEVVIETSGTSGDTRMWLYDSSLNEIEFNDDSGTNFFSRIDRVCGTDELPADTYYVKVNEFGSNNEIFSYDISLTVTPCTTSNNAPNGVIDTPSGNINISVWDTVDFTGTYSDPDGDFPQGLNWSFGAGSGIPDSPLEDPGLVQFNNPGTFVVTFTVTDSLGLSDPTPDTRTITVQSGSSVGTVIPQSNWSLLFVDSEELVGENGAAVNAFDGDVNTIWHTQWRGGSPAHPHEIRIDLGQFYDIDGFRYMPRQNGGINGTIGQYEFYVSSDGVNWGVPVATGTFANDATEKEVLFGTTTGRYIRLRALSEVNGNPWASMAEINVMGIM